MPSDPRSIGRRTAGPAWQAASATLIALTAVIITFCGSADAGEKVLVDGVLHVRNGQVPSQGTETLRLRELWRAGGPEDEETLFGLVSDVAGDEEGNTYVLDAQLCQVHVYGPHGNRLRTLFREGEGPGEVRAPRDLVMLDEGQVGLVEEFPGKIVVVDRMDNPKGSIVPSTESAAEGGWVSLTIAVSRNGHLVCTGQQPRPAERPNTQSFAYFVAAFSRDGKQTARYLETQNTRDFTDFVFSEKTDTPAFWWATEVGPDGRVYAVADRDRYAISVFRPDGELERVIEREYVPWKRTAAEVERMRLLYESAIGGLSIPYRIDIEETEPAISYWHRALRVADDGMLWVVSSRGIREQQAGTMLTYDVFDPAGNFVKQLSVACEGDGINDALFFVGAGHAVLIKGYLDALAAQFGRGTAFSTEGEEHTVPEVICYQISE